MTRRSWVILALLVLFLGSATWFVFRRTDNATVVRAETDAEGAAYEVHMSRSDGTEITVKLDSSFTVTETVTGRG